ncbi:hypothetical protein [Okeania sp. SIO3B5]|nr:hypothetical protein [Okeania sp. SIO3B5]
MLTTIKKSNYKLYFDFMEPSINLKQAIEKRRSARAFSKDSIPNLTSSPA